MILQSLTKPDTRNTVNKVNYIFRFLFEYFYFLVFYLNMLLGIVEDYIISGVLHICLLIILNNRRKEHCGIVQNNQGSV